MKRMHFVLPLSVIKHRKLLFAAIVALVFGASFFVRERLSQPSPSSELGIAAVSPSGETGGFVVPASCPSNLHDSPFYGQPCVQCNLCGSCNNGTYQCGTTPPCSTNKSGVTECHGTVCSVSAPANPPGVGDPCTATNACGQTYPPSTVCSGTKSSPLTVLHAPPCSSTELYYPGGGMVLPNCLACDLTTGYPSNGIVQCDGSCSGIAPPNPVGYGTPCSTASTNICGMHGTGIIGCSGTCEAVVPLDSACTHSLQICENSCSSGIYYANGGSFSMMDTDPAKRLVACYTDQPACSDATPGANVTATVTWSAANVPSDAIALSGANPKLVTPNPLPSFMTRTENISATYPLVSMTSTVTAAVTKFCASNCSTDSGSYCMGESYTGTNTCGNPEACTGTRYCDFNWKEVAP